LRFAVTRRTVPSGKQLPKSITRFETQTHFSSRWNFGEEQALCTPPGSKTNGGKGLTVGAIDGIAGPEDRGRQDLDQKATTATKVKNVDPKPIPHTRATQTGKQATMQDEKARAAHPEPHVKSSSPLLARPGGNSRKKTGAEAGARRDT
jgi:hypothetical protein